MNFKREASALTTTAVLGYCLGLFWMLVLGCTSPQQQSAAQDLAETVTAVTKDGVVTQDEADLVQVKMKAYTDAPGTDWRAVLGAGIGSVAAGLFGLRYLPNRYIIGGPEDAHLAKASGAT